jgi:hypothetical protein
MLVAFCPTAAPLQVAAWLGVSDVDAVMEQEGLNPEYELGRRQGLGLGAKHLPHSKVRRRGPPLDACLAGRSRQWPSLMRLGWAWRRRWA